MPSNQTDASNRSRFKSNRTMIIIDPGNGKIIDAKEAEIFFYGWHHEKIIQIKVYKNVGLKIKPKAAELEERMDNEESQTMD